MITVTQQQRDNALDALNNMWPSVPPENVIKDLLTWRKGKNPHAAPTCGTVACFGGWCTWWPAFRDQGVRSTLNGTPTIKPGYPFAYGSVAQTLFGDYTLFWVRGEHDADLGFTGNDHELVTNRLKFLIKNSVVAA